MGYTAVKGGADAIAAAEQLIQRLCTQPDEALLEIRQLRNQLGAAVDKVMGEGGVYAPDLAALAIKQTEGDLFEAAFILRAYRSTLPRLGSALPTRGDEMRLRRRISSAFRDIPQGQLLGRTRDYTQRLLDFGQLDQSGAPSGLAVTHAPGGNGSATVADPPPTPERRNGHAVASDAARAPKVSDVMRAMGIMAPLPDQSGDVEPFDITRDSMRFPVSRPSWLQALARGESGALVCLAYSSLRGYGGRGGHGTIGELRVGDLPLRMTHPILRQPVIIGHFRATEVEMVGAEHDARSPGTKLPSYGLSYGLVFGQHERKAIAMALLDSTLQATAPVEGDPAPANDQEMVLYHVDGIESFGFVEHLKLPHFVTFGSGLQATLEQRRQQPDSGARKNGHGHAASTTPAVPDDHEGADGRQLHHHGDGVMHSHNDD